MVRNSCSRKKHFGYVVLSLACLYGKKTQRAVGGAEMYVRKAKIDNEVWEEREGTGWQNGVWN